MCVLICIYAVCRILTISAELGTCLECLLDVIPTLEEVRFCVQYQYNIINVNIPCKIAQGFLFLQNFCLNEFFFCCTRDSF